MTRIPDSPTVLWQLHKDGRCFTCAVRLTPAGLRLEQWIGTKRLVSQTLQTEADLYQQAEVVRQESLADGWSATLPTQLRRNP